MKLQQILLLAVTLGASTLAAHADTLTVGATVNGGTSGNDATPISYTLNGVAGVGEGGNLTGSTGTIGNQSVTFSQLWCVDILDDLDLSTTYTASYANNGTIQNGTPVNDAGQIAWLIDNLAASATTQDQNLALQAAIWQVEYGSSFVLSSTTSADVLSDFNSDLSALGNNTASVSSFEWVSPTNPDGSNAQGLVGTLAPTPEPSSLMLLGTGLLGFAESMRRRVRSRRMQ
jgi:hypothetical protein